MCKELCQILECVRFNLESGMKCLSGMTIFLILIWTFTAGAEGPLKFSLTSSAFKDQDVIANKFSCHGADVNPELNIANIPENTKSLAMIVDDPDAPEGIWVHWVVYNISPKTTRIAENSKVGVEGLNDFGTFRYRGPCPPNKKVHHYSFRVYALKNKLELNEGFIKSDLESAMRGKIIAQARLVGTYQNSDTHE